MIGPYLAHGILPLRDKPGAHVASARPLQVRRGGFVVFALSGIDDTHGLSAPQASGQFGMWLLQLHGRWLGGVMTEVFQCYIVRDAH